MSQTDKHLKAAYTGEAEAYLKYLEFAKKADQEGFPQIARLFRAVAAAEIIHARHHLNAIRVENVGSTQNNLKNAIGGELYEISHMYPAYIEQAEKDGAHKAIKSFTDAYETEKIHERLFAAALKAIDAGTDLPAIDYYLCEVCGFTADREVPEKCPLCAAGKEKFLSIESFRPPLG